ncbi:PAAR-like domain-containing protein [Roseateles sp. UC29_93]|uniref:PAAR-like domain-containing protein n=1 Tax=Roseateles sp. UC29_93 TaxID=3350177 RepID=UPI00366E8ABF
MPATHVYANGQEIASKAVGSSGVSSSASPDPCWSPPGPAAGPVVIPYPNTCFADSIVNGTKTVMIVGQMVAIENKSRFDTSIGNEPATQAFGKGVATGVIKGKAYFTNWSSDVVFEGFGVPRNLDLVTHNHGSMPSNTPTFPYVSRGFWGGHPCKKEEARVERACAPEKDHSESRNALKKHSKLSQLLRKFRSKNDKASRRDGAGWHWTDDHCDGLGAMVNTAEKAKEYAGKLEEAYKHLPEELNLMNALKEQLTDMAFNAGKNAAMKWGAKAGAKQLAGSAVPAWGNAAMALWSVVDAAVAVGDISEIRSVATESLERLEVLTKKAKDLQALGQKFGDFKNLSDEDVLKLATEGQDVLATVNDCTRARKCNLVPYDGDGAGNPLGKRGRSKIESASSGGCCPGQTGHHLIPGGSVKDVCPEYEHGVAPTVCVEGFSQNHGSHARAHQALARLHRSKQKLGKVGQDMRMSMDDAIDAAADSHKEAFPLSGCSKECIRAQLESYYDRVCRGARPAMVNEQSKVVTPDAPAPTTPTAPGGR